MFVIFMGPPILVISALDFKALVKSVPYMLHSGFLRFTSDVTPADLLVAKPF